MADTNRTIPISRRLARIWGAAMVTVLLLSSAVPTARAASDSGLPWQAPVSLLMEEDVDVRPSRLLLCLGTEEQVRVTLWRAIWWEDEQPPPAEGVTGAEILLWGEDPDGVVDLEQTQIITTLFYASDPPYAVFTARARRVGKAEYTFQGPVEDDTGAKRTGGGQGTLSIEVIPCYYAYQSALGSVWPKKDVCRLDQDFELQGLNPDMIATGLENLDNLPDIPGMPAMSELQGLLPDVSGQCNSATEVLRFYPHLSDPRTGAYNMVQSMGCRDYRCVERVSGVNSYQVKEYFEQERADILLGGDSTKYCPGVAPLTSPVGYQIELRWLETDAYVCNTTAPPPLVPPPPPPP